MSIKTRKEIIADAMRTTRIVIITVLAVILTAWLGLGTYAMIQVDDLKEKVEYYEQKEEEKQNSGKTIEVNGQKYIMVEDV